MKPASVCTPCSLPYSPRPIQLQSDGNLKKIRDLTKDAPLPKKSPFKQILAVGDGTCGSSCDTFSRTAWFHAANNPKVKEAVQPSSSGLPTTLNTVYFTSGC